MRKKTINLGLSVMLLLCIANANVYSQSLDNRLCEKEKCVLDANIGKELKKQEMDIKLTTRYGFTPPQLQQYKAIRKESRLHIKQIRESDLSRAEKYSRIKEVRHRALKDIQNILSSEQWARFTLERRIDCDRNKKIQGIIMNYKKELRMLSQQSSNISKKAVRNKLRGKCKLELLDYVDKKCANRIMQKINKERISKSKEFQFLSLSNSEKKTLAYIKLRHQRQIRKLKLEKLPLKITRNRRKAIDEIYCYKIKDKIGTPRFDRWRKFHDTAFERRCKEEFNFSELQLSQYKDIKNRTALARFKINHSELTEEQKKIRIIKLLNQENSNIKKYYLKNNIVDWKNLRS